ncbi:hypothetical protein ABPG72_002676 [Tetrahymena utriculariae]
MRGYGQKYGGGQGLQPITELESENHTSMYIQNYNQVGLQQSNGGAINNNLQQSQGVYNQQQHYSNPNFVREENLKYIDLEKIFSDTDDSASRMNDSLLDDCDNLVPKENQRQFQQNVLNQFQNYKTQTNKDLTRSYGQNYQNDKSLDLTLNLTRNYNSGGGNNMIVGGAHENSINDSLMYIVNELGGDNRFRHQGTPASINSNNNNNYMNNNNQINLNDTQMIYQKYEDTVKMMSQLQRQLGTSVDSNQASLLLRSDKFRSSLENNNEAIKRSQNQQIIGGISQQPLQQPQIQQTYSSGSNSGGNSPSTNIQFNLRQPKPQIENNKPQLGGYKQNEKITQGPSITNQYLPNTQSTSISSDYRQNPNFNNSNGFEQGLAYSNLNQNNTALKYSLQSPQLNQSMNNSNNQFQYLTPQSNKQVTSQFANNSTVFSSPQSIQSSQFSAFQAQGMNPKQRRIFNMEQKAILKQAEQRIQLSNDPFLYQKRMEQEILSDRNYQKMVEEELPVFCINCEEYIKLNDVDKHAEGECEAFQKRKAQQKSNPSTNSGYGGGFRAGDGGDSYLNEITEKIVQIEQQIGLRLTKLKQLPYHQQNNQLIEASEAVLRQSQNIRLNNENAIQINHSIQQIQLQRQQVTVLQNDNKNVGVLILWDRLIFLADEKALRVRYFKERQQNLNMSIGNTSQDREIMMLEQELKKLESLTQKEKEKVQYWKMQSEMMEQIKKQDINNLKYIKDNHSYQIIKNLQSERDSETQSSAGLSSQTGDFIITNQLQINNPVTQNAEDRKKIFFKEALNVKFSFPQNHRSRNVDLQQLYDAATKQNVPQQQWPEFIRSRMNQI